MGIGDAIDCGIMLVNEDGSFKYNGLCNKCIYSECYAYPAALLNLPCATISAYASSGAKALGRYTFGVCRELEFCTDPLYVEWDKVRNEILTAGR